MKIILLSILLSFAHSSLFAEKMDLSAHNDVIERLELALSELTVQDPSYRPTIIRLADLYADRSRINFIKENEENCQNCKASKIDREKALKNYKEILTLNALTQEQKEKALFQMAHLQIMGGEPNKAKKVYLGIIGDRRSSLNARTQAQINYADLLYQESSFKKAIGIYQQAYPNAKNKGYVLYRQAWCELNIGNNKKAQEGLLTILKNRNLTDISGSDPSAVSAFRKDVARDLVTFYARTPVTMNEVNNIYSFSPEESKKDNLFFLVDEIDRLGQKSSAVVVLNHLGKLDLSQKEKIEIQIRKANVYLDINNKRLAQNEMAGIVRNWKNNGCGEKAECEELKDKFRKFVIHWDRLEKKERSMNLVGVYQSYLSLFADDFEMQYWAGNVAREIKNYRLANSFYHNAAEAGSSKKEAYKIFDLSLMAEIETAELSGDKALRKKSYDHYLGLNNKGEKALEVNYQQAHLLYEKAQYREAADAFYEIAMQGKGYNSGLKIKAADLSLDALAAIKADDQIQEWSKDYAERFPEKRAEYNKIAFKSVLNESAKTINQAKNSDGDYKKALAKLKSTSIANATREETISYYKNYYIAAQKLKSFGDMKWATVSLLSLSYLSRQDREEETKRRIWMAEMELDFVTAYNLSKSNPDTSISQAENELKLGTLAELAGKDSQKHYSRYLDLNPSSTKVSNEIRAKIIRKSKNPEQIFNREFSQLKRSPEIYAPLALEIYAKKQNKRFGETLMKERSFRFRPESQIVARDLSLDRFLNLKNDLRRHQLNYKSDKNIKRTLNERIAKIHNAEQLLNYAAQLKDWTLQVMMLELLAQENKRLANNIASFPVPRGLTKLEKAKYRDFLKQQSEPYIAQSEMFKQKASDFWGNSDAINAIERDFAHANTDVRRLFKKHIVALYSVAPKSEKKDLVEITQYKDSKPSSREIEKARVAVKQNPFDEDKIENLIELEKRNGKDVLVAYLDTRLNQVRKQ